MRTWNDAMREAIEAGAKLDDLKRHISKQADPPSRECWVEWAAGAADTHSALLAQGWAADDSGLYIDVDPLSPAYDSRSIERMLYAPEPS